MNEELKARLDQLVRILLAELILSHTCFPEAKGPIDYLASKIVPSKLPTSQEECIQIIANSLTIGTLLEKLVSDFENSLAIKAAGENENN